MPISFAAIVSFLYLCMGLANSKELKLYAPMFIKKGDLILVNCTAETSPIGEAAEFLVNGITYTSLSRREYGCYSAILRSQCPQMNCSCSDNGQTYTLLLDSSNYITKIQIACRMKFPFKRIEDSLTIKIVDMLGPFIATNMTNGGFPLVAGMPAYIECSTSTQLTDIIITWMCFHQNQAVQEMRNSTTVKSFLQINVVAEHHGQNCTCVVNWKNFTTEVTFAVDIIYSPVIEMKDLFVCNTSAFEWIEIRCDAFGDLKDYGFTEWLHSYNGHVIRSLKGDTFGNSSSLTLPCSYQEAGEYTCTCWNNYSSNTFWTNKTTSFFVQGPPVAVADNILTENTVLLSIEFFTQTKPFATEWLANNDPIVESLGFMMITYEKNITLDIYGKVLNVSGYISNLSMTKRIPGSYYTVLKNEFGRTSKQFIIKNVDYDFSIRSVFWTLTGVVVLVLSIVTTTVLFRRQRFRNVTNFISTSHQRALGAIYYAAPPIDTNENPYEMTDMTNALYLDIIEYQSTELVIDASSQTHKDSRRTSLNMNDDTPHYMEIN